MSTATLSLPAIAPRRGAAKIVGAVRDTFAVSVRNLIAYKRVP